MTFQRSHHLNSPFVEKRIDVGTTTPFTRRFDFRETVSFDVKWVMLASFDVGLEHQYIRRDALDARLHRRR